MSDKYLLDKLSRDFKSISGSLSEISKERDSLLAKLEAAEKEIEDYKKRWLDTKSERDNLRVQFEQERAINAVLREGLKQIEMQADMCDNPWASEYASETLTKAKEMRDGE